MRLPRALLLAPLFAYACSPASHDRTHAEAARSTALDVVLARASLTPRVFTPFEARALVHRGTAFAHAASALSITVADHAAGATKVDAGKGAWASIVDDDLDADVAAVTEGNALVFAGAKKDADVVRVIASDRVEELRVLSGAKGTASGRWKIDLGPAIADVLLRHEQLYFVDAGGLVKLLTTRIEAVDANGVHRAPTLEITGSGATRTLLATLDVHDLAAPVVLDPTWTTVAPMNYPREFHTATTLPDGRVLVAGGNVPPEYYDPAANKWTIPADSPVDLTGSTAALLGDGTVLYGGGSSDKELTIYTPASNSWALDSFALLHGYQQCHAETRLQNGSLLFAGCAADGPSNAEIVDPVAKTTTDAGTMASTDATTNFPTLGTGVLLPNGKVLFAGFGGLGTSTGTGAQIFDPTTKTWASSAIKTRRGYPAAVALPDGRVMVAGGVMGAKAVAPLGVVEIYDPVADTWTNGPNLTTPRAVFSAVRLGTTVLMIGGTNNGFASEPTDLYDTTTNTMRSGPSTSTGHTAGAAALLADGSVLVAGGTDTPSDAVKTGISFSTSTVEILALPAAGSTCAGANGCAFGLTCLDGVCCASASCPSGSACNNAGHLGTCTKSLGTTCTDATQCGSGFCVDGVCCENACGPGVGQCNVTGHLGRCQSLNGLACSDGSTCVSGVCADGVCCDVACNGCKACTAAKKGSGADGTCGPIAAGADPNDFCPVDPSFPNDCKSDGNCDGAGACRTFAPPGTPCGSTSCLSGAVVGNVCNGSGLCNAATVSCAPFACVGTSCATACTTNGDCATGAYCSSAGVCVQSTADGLPCSAGSECSSGFCVDGVCCKSACTGQCEACAETGTAGSCVPVTGAPRGSRPACAGDPASCGGTCSGSDPTKCALAPANKRCGSTCTGGIVTKSSCDGAGTCSPGDPQNCIPFACDSTGTTCAVTCAADGDCATGYHCSKGECVPSAGSTCSSDGASSIDVDGKTTSCAPFLCDPTSGSCRQVCASSDECVAGATCDDASKTCLSGSSGGGTGSGGGCAIGDRSPMGAFATLALAVAGAWLGRRRRAQS